MTPLAEPDALIAPGSRLRVREAAEANGSRRVWVLASKSVAAGTPIVKEIEAALGGLHAATHVGIGQHAPEAAVGAATASARAANVDTIVSIGGGSVMDAGKFVAWTLSAEGKGPLPLHVAIPTTLSGAEFTFLAGRSTIGRDGRPVKGGLADPRLVPDVVLMDPEACAFTPRWLWAATGLRAVDHAAEGITGGLAAPAVLDRCIAALRRLKEHLPRSYGHAADGSAAQACLGASREASAGINYAGAGSGLSHALGKAVGATWSIPHGITSAIFLPAVLGYEAKRAPERVRPVAEALGGTNASEAVLRLVHDVGIERKPLRAYGVKPTDVPRIVEYALGRREPAIEALVLGLV